MNYRLSTILVVSSLALALSGCGRNADVVQTAPMAPAANSTPAANSAPANPAPSGDNAATNGVAQVANTSPGTPGLMGTVTAVDGTTIAVEDQRQQSTTTLTLTDSTQILKQTTIDLASIPVGETVSAFGTQEAETFIAQQVQVGAAVGFDNREPAGGPNGGTPPTEGMPTGGGQPPAGAPGGGSGGRGPAGGGAWLAGTVTQVTERAITVATADETSVQLQLAENGRVTQQLLGSSADLTTGVQVMVMSDQSGAPESATQIQIMSAMEP